MTVRVYRSTDVGAPVVGLSLGSLITLLDACLVNGYGTKSPLGWTKPFSGTNKAVYRQGGGLQRYLRFDDSVGTDFIAAGSTSRISMAVGATGIDTLIDSVSYTPGAMYMNKPETNANGGSWVLVGDETSFWLMTKRAQWAGYSTCFFGDLLSFAGPQDSDLGKTAMILPLQGSTGATALPSNGEYAHFSWVANSAAQGSYVCMGDPDGVVPLTGVICNKQLMHYNVSQAQYPLHYPSLYWSGPPVSQAVFGLTANVISPGYEWRGVVPGYYAPLANTNRFFPPQGTQFTYTAGPMAGKVLEVFYGVDNSGTTVVPFMLDIASDWGW